MTVSFGTIHYLGLDDRLDLWIASVGITLTYKWSGSLTSLTEQSHISLLEYSIK